MMLDNETLIEMVDAYHIAENNAAEAARRLGIPVETLKSRLRMAAARNIRGSGESLGGVTPPGFIIKGTSTLYDEDGHPRAQWVKTQAEAPEREALVEALHTAFKEYTGTREPLPAPRLNEPDLLTGYMLADHHLGMYSWARETGANYDLGIAKRILFDAMTELVARSPASETALVLNLGDFFHSDSDENRTRHSGNPLDVDTRYAKVLQLGVDLMLMCVDLALQKHKRVVVRCLPGNHDPYAALALTVALAAFYANDPRVEVDTDPSPFFWFSFGNVFIAATHGDRVKPADMPGVMASFKPQEWGEAKYRYAYFGHVHHKSIGGGEHHGVVWETFQTLAAKDAWHKAMGYSSGRSMTAITFDRNRGEIFRHVVSIGGD